LASVNFDFPDSTIALALVISRGKPEEEDSPEATLPEPELRRKAGGQPGNNNAGKKYL
jgi:hypothetical protein